jgi:HEAT repeat protein
VSSQIQHFIQELSGQTRQVRRATLQLQRAGSEAVAPLIDALSTTDQISSQQAIMWVLSKLRDQRAAPILTVKLNSANYHISHSAARALVGLGVVEPLLEALHSEKDIVRETAIDGLGEFGDRQYIPLLTTMLPDPSERIRSAAIGALRKLHASDAIEPLGIRTI